jgi:hypothetical protein
MKIIKQLSRIEQLQFRISHAKENYTKALNRSTFIETQPLRQNIDELEEELEVAMAGNHNFKAT